MTAAVQTRNSQPHFITDDLGMIGHGMDDNRRASINGDWSGNRHDRGSKPEPDYPHIHDLVAKGSPSIDINTPVRSWHFYLSHSYVTDGA